MPLTERQKLYLLHSFNLRQTEKDILSHTDLTKEEFKNWWVELEDERKRIKPIRDHWITKKCQEVMDYYEFEAQYLGVKNCCHYCQITQQEINQLWEIEKTKGKDLTKRGRGRKLELERMAPNTEYSDLKNLVFACYWCNNAKTDTFTSEEFKEVGEVFRIIWNKRLRK